LVQPLATGEPNLELVSEGALFAGKRKGRLSPALEGDEKGVGRSKSVTSAAKAGHILRGLYGPLKSCP